MQNVFPVAKMPDAPVDGLFILQHSALRPGWVCGFLSGHLFQFGSDAPSLRGRNALKTREAGA